MKKRFQFLVRYFRSSRHFRLWRARWVNLRSLMVVGIAVIFLSTLAWTAPFDHSAAASPDQAAQVSTAVPTDAGQAAETPDPDAPPTRTPLPAEYLSNGSQTIGITLASVVLVIIVVVGVLLFMPRRDEG